MRPLILLLAGLMAAPTASAASHELAVEFGTLATSDTTSWSMVSPTAMSLSLGVRGDYALSHHWAIQADWHHTQTGTGLYDANGNFVGQTAYFGNEAAVGVRFDWPLKDLFVPYVHADGVLYIGNVRFDDNPTDKHSPGQISETALAGGGRGMLGAEVRIPRPQRKGFTGAFYLEGGYTWLTKQQFATVGDLTLRGFTFRSGIGLVY